MKITTPARVLLVILSLVMVFSLFACAEEVTTVTDTQGTDAQTEAPEETAGATEAPTTAVTEAPTAEATETPTETEEPTEPACEHEEVVVPGKAATCTEAGLTDGKVCSKCEEVLVAQTTIAALGHKLDAGTSTQDAKCGEAGEVIFKCTNAGCDYTETEVVAALAHDYEENVTLAPTCTNAGTKTTTCKRDGCEYSATEEIAALGHDYEENVTLDPTCIAAGSKTVTCKRDGCEYSEDVEIAIDPTAHAPMEVDPDNNCNIVCSLCEAVIEEGVHGETELRYVEGDGYADFCKACNNNATEFRPFNVYFDAAALDGVPAETTTGVYNAEGGFTRYAGNENTYEAYIHLGRMISGNTGNYLIIKYKTNIGQIKPVEGKKNNYNSTIQFYYGTETDEAGKGASKQMSLVSDDQWHIIIYNFHDDAKYKPVDGVYSAKHVRIDIINPDGAKADDVMRLPAENYIDIGFIAMCDNIDAFATFIEDEANTTDKALCPHLQTEKSELTPNENGHGLTCGLCGAAMNFAAHTPATGLVYNAETKCYEGTCACGVVTTSSFLIQQEVDPKVSTTSTLTYETLTEDGEDFVRYTWTGVDTETFTALYSGGSAYSGQYMVVKYRAPKGANAGSFSNAYGGTVESPNSGATGGSDALGNLGSLISDGEWHYFFVDLAAKNKASVDAYNKDKEPEKQYKYQFAASADGKYYAKYVRASWSRSKYVDENGETKNAYFDIAFVAFADNIDAIDNYIKNNSTTHSGFLTQWDAVNNKLDGQTFMTANVVGDGVAAVVDMSAYTLKTPTSLELGGWFLTRGGVVSYGYRVVSVDGEAVEADVIKTWEATGDRKDVYGVYGAARGYGEDSANGAGCSIKFDLSEYAGHKVNVEVFAVTAIGYEIVTTNVINITVPEAAPAQ